MLRSMFSAVSGLRSHQTMMDVVGNNVSNVNTAGYKSSRATFQETLTQVVRGGTEATASAIGGVNPMQIGLGARTGAIDAVFSQGATQSTGRITDVAIDGPGFLVVQNGLGEVRFSRAGALSFDSQGQLVTPTGDLVMGYQQPGAPTDPIDTTALAGQPGWVVSVDLSVYREVSIGLDGVISGRNTTTNEIDNLGVISLATFANDGGLTRIGTSLFAEAANSGAPDFGAPTAGGRGGLQSGTLEMSNVDLALEFTNMIMAQRGFQANSRTITASDELLQDLVNLKR